LISLMLGYAQAATGIVRTNGASNFLSIKIVEFSIHF